MTFAGVIKDEAHSNILRNATTETAFDIWQNDQGRMIESAARVVSIMKRIPA
ncbi:hypothetical protein Poly24_54980 [Rosistilla carotiformis]|uniref:Uncharacterized protein n=1 Tax=Rosistilla carotiformis TaxID=2528017 RepID=A0A518K1R3_9BACT|nr:hypothetical protein Poly24_54980 [Rosistilla carotiformis]